MISSHVNSLVEDLETTLDLLNNLMAELREVEAKAGPFPRIDELLKALSGRQDLNKLPKLLLTAYSEVSAALGGIRLSREAIQSQAIDQLRVTHTKLAEVSSHTEDAATAMLDGLDRTLVVIDRMSDSGPASDNALQESVTTLREEVNELFNCLQFQDITAQQLRGAVDLLVDVEDRLQSVANLFDSPTASTQEREALSKWPETYDPEASMHSAASRQELADEALQFARVHGNGKSDRSEGVTSIQ